MIIDQSFSGANFCLSAALSYADESQWRTKLINNIWKVACLSKLIIMTAIRVQTPNKLRNIPRFKHHVPCSTLTLYIGRAGPTDPRID